MDRDIVERGLAAAAVPMARGAPAGSAHVLGAVTMLLSGVDHPATNFLTVHAPVEDPQRDLEPALHAMDGTGDRYTLFIREPSDEVVAWLTDRGLQPDDTAPGMAMALTEPPPEATTIAVDRIATSAEHEVWIAIVCEVFGMPMELGYAMVDASSLEDPQVIHLLGTHGTEPCATATAVVVDDLVVVFNVAVRIGQRGLGYGREMTWAAIGEGYRRGARTAVLSSSDAGHPVYQRMGFADVSTLHGFVRAEA